MGLLGKLKRRLTGRRRRSRRIDHQAARERMRQGEQDITKDFPRRNLPPGR